MIHFVQNKYTALCAAVEAELHVVFGGQAMASSLTAVNLFIN